ncbi:histidine--tRNA ligase [candidate division WWE3 bacterium RIFCSPHIGHO2_01_FULL_40_23]|uniref:Histidine--tRNA ligase n=1 Tax=candidate division WWE3 bacterium RIFCSPLOWO2_01_FULL_41_18 TaxID=1802625 RepID=A0A1F4VDY6_UNCKA|nr:MAG: histidine--tRNA ligase [candidate division WWE3 bacterium RIFCSPHIGHO2_01_FULL_40_23]OGC55461.1 MAG: histidine--tRNA ligase [candidate division WWE3 bacterium RIFCSPLOWO2_01_FULL_41_18]
MLSTQPYKGVRDFFPDDIKVRNYIFDTWRKVCLSFGYEEYDGPFLEPFELFSAKTGDEIVNNQLYSFEDKSGRKVAIRPEMTPTVSRMAAEKIRMQTPLPLKWFSIADFYRYEKPQKGRGREFYQLNVDIFGEESVNAELEILLLNKGIMEKFGATDKMYEVRFNNRFLMNYLYERIASLTVPEIKAVQKAVDKKAKISNSEFESLLEKDIDKSKIKKVHEVLNLTISDIKKLKDLPDKASNLLKLMEMAQKVGIKNIIYDPALVRGLDYYDGNVFEQYDLTKGNNRSMFGGGRYDGLISLFIDKKVPAVGFAPGDITLMEFLKSWNLLPETGSLVNLLVTVFPGNKACLEKSLEVSEKLREYINVETYLNPDMELTKQLKYADRKSIPFVLIIGPDELAKELLLIKNLKTEEQSKMKSLQDVVKLIKS